MSQWTYRSGSFVGGSLGTGAQTCAKPTGTASGDLVLFMVYQEPSGHTLTGSNGLVSAGRQNNTGNADGELFYKIAGGSEPSSYTFTPSIGGDLLTSAGVAYQNGTGAGPWIDIAGSSSGDSVIDGSQTAPSVTTTGVDRLVVYSYINQNGDTASGMNGFCTNFRGSSNGVTFGDAAKAAAGATGTSSATGTGTQNYVALHTAFISDTGAGGVTMAPATVTASLAGQAVTLVQTANYTVAPSVYALSLAGQTPAIGAGVPVVLTDAAIHIRPVGFV